MVLNDIKPASVAGFDVSALDGQSFPSFGASALQDISARSPAHALEETVVPIPFFLFRLISSLWHMTRCCHYLLNLARGLLWDTGLEVDAKPDLLRPLQKSIPKATFAEIPIQSYPETVAKLPRRLCEGLQARSNLVRSSSNPRELDARRLASPRPEASQRRF